MTQTVFLSLVATGFAVAFAHAVIPTHWLPFVLASRGQRWSTGKTLMVVAVCGSGHVLFTVLLGALVVWLGIETSRWTGSVFPWIAGGVLILLGLYYIVRQLQGAGHDHLHFGAGHRHGHEHEHDHDHAHGAVTRRIDTGHGVLLLEMFEDGTRHRFRLRGESAAALPQADALTLETLRRDGGRQTFSFVGRDGFLESREEIPEPHAFTANLVLSHGDHAHRHDVAFVEHELAHEHGAQARTAKSDRAVILGLFTLLTFSPCEGFLPVYLSGIGYGWIGFVLLSAVLAVATIAGMMVLTWLTMSGIGHARDRLRVLERYEGGILGAVILLLGVGIVAFGF